MYLVFKMFVVNAYYAKTAHAIEIYFARKWIPSNLYQYEKSSFGIKMNSDKIETGTNI